MLLFAPPAKCLTSWSVMIHHFISMICRMCSPRARQNRHTFHKQIVNWQLQDDTWFSWLGNNCIKSTEVGLGWDRIHYGYHCQTSWPSWNPTYEYQLSWNLINAYQELIFFHIWICGFSVSYGFLVTPENGSRPILSLHILDQCYLVENAPRLLFLFFSSPTGISQSWGAAPFLSCQKGSSLKILKF